MKNKKNLIGVVVLLLSTLLSGCRVEITALYDTVILGSGVSGLTTALELNENGKRVLVVEESGIVGGNNRLISDGVSYLNTANGDDPALFLTDVETNNGSSNFFTRKMIETSAFIPEWLQKYNIHLEETVKLPGHALARTLVSAKGTQTGKEVITKLESAIKSSKVTLNYNSRVTKITYDKKLYHLTIEQKNAVINVDAKTIVFAETDGMSYSAGIPMTNDNQLNSNNFTSQITISTGNELLRAFGVETAKTSELNIVDTYNIASGQQISGLVRSYGGFLVNQEGKRFVNEMADSQTIIKAILQQTNQNAYLVYDDVIESRLAFLSEYYTGSTVVKADTITDFAYHLQMDEAQIRTTISNYRKMILSGTDTDFSRTFDGDTRVFRELGTDRGHLVAIKVNPVMTSFSPYAEITDKFEVMRSNVILTGVYATGDTAVGVHLSNMLPGTEMTNALTMGKVTAENVLEYLTKNGL